MRLPRIERCTSITLLAGHHWSLACIRALHVLEMRCRCVSVVRAVQSRHLRLCGGLHLAGQLLGTGLPWPRVSLPSVAQPRLAFHYSGFHCPCTDLWAGDSHRSAPAQVDSLTPRLSTLSLLQGIGSRTRGRWCRGLRASQFASVRLVPCVLRTSS